MLLAELAKLGLENAIKNKTAIGLVVDGVPLMFKSIAKIEEHDTGVVRIVQSASAAPTRHEKITYVAVYGQLEGDTFKALRHGELNHWVYFHLEDVRAVIDGDHSGAVLDDK